MKTVFQKTLALASLLAFTLALSGCSPDPAEAARRAEREKEIEEQLKNPKITSEGVFDGCEVKFVDRYYQDKSFYLVRCGTTVTQTAQVTERNGKYSSTHTKVTVVQEEATEPSLQDSKKALEEALRQAQEQGKELEALDRKLKEKQDALSTLQGKIAEHRKAIEALQARQ